MIVGLTYNRASLMVMSYNITETPQEAANLQQGKTALGAAVPGAQAIAVIDAAALKQPLFLPDLLALAQQQLGLALLAPAICAEVNAQQNMVVDICRADPTSYARPGHLAFAAPTAGIGWAYDPVGKTLTSPAAIDPKTLQPIPQTVLSVAVSQVVS